MEHVKVTKAQSERNNIFFCGSSSIVNDNMLVQVFFLKKKMKKMKKNKNGK